jgi:hypothetical protein
LILATRSAGGDPVDKISIWDFDQHGVLAPNDPSSVRFRPETGRGMFIPLQRPVAVFDPGGSSTIVLFDYDSTALCHCSFNARSRWKA